MNSMIIKPKNEILKKYIQYFLFFKKTDQELLNYTTFPNTNLCLAIYKHNQVSYTNEGETNLCEITNGNTFISRLYGFHKTPFNVNIHCALDQICIVFQPSALRVFTDESYENLMLSETVFDEIFPFERNFLDEIFDMPDFAKRADALEILLCENLKDNIPYKIKEALILINNNEFLSIDELSKNLKISETTLFRLFKNNLGQNPKSYLKTIRFRNVLNDILKPRNSLTGIAYQNQYYDQSHFIKDFKNLTGFAPNKIAEKISVTQKDLAWIYQKLENE
ncbi:helix-turn-helix transcriptional regulator [Chryseobacterium sp. BIGb0232]|uniref:helix-turn-helix transcriptional regulator n=1 Tax=Chryseobacterium sp. BIGb0232 TaxID=2940598 RepID=UPI000F4A80DD|nr:helix-turn-helix transcriptional regulator [Chryseobacterium sp. BIGb0232]MCS4303408.1 AraC-like DNA-binding protein [Chryseobacterium sp. BIGb0232]ROS11321.1 AraC-like DNA-binding protein [Chryseobacterium nakagawai]